MPTEHKFSSARLGKPVPEQRPDEELGAYLKRRDRVAEANHRAGLLTPSYRYMRDDFTFANKLASARTYFAEEIVKLYGTRKRSAGQPPAPPSRPTSPTTPKPNPRPPAKPDRPVGASTFAHLNGPGASAIQAEAVAFLDGRQAAEVSASAVAIHAAALRAQRPMKVTPPAPGSVAEEILSAAAKARSKTRAWLPPVGSAARAILNAGRKARGEAPHPE